MMSTERNLLPDIRDALSLSLPEAAASAWLTLPNASLGGQRPIEALRAGQFAEVYAAALAI